MANSDSSEKAASTTRDGLKDSTAESTRLATSEAADIELAGELRWAPADRSPGPDSARCFGRYVLGPALGQGGAGTVYKAHDTLLDIPVVLKLPRVDADFRLAKTANFLLEARTLARLNHPQLCRVFDYGEIEGQPFISMAFADGRRLNRLIDSSPRKTADLVRTIALALDERIRSGLSIAISSQQTS